MNPDPSTNPRFAGLWRSPDFIKLWAGQTVSLFGSQITLLALPLTAITFLGASPAEMGVLGALHGLSFLLVGLFAGVWVDRVRRRPILIWTDVGRMLLLLSIPAAMLLGILSIWHLYAVVFLVGLLTLFFDVAYRSALPSLVGREQLVEGNSKLELSRSAAEVGGPGVAGVLVQLVTAPMAIFADALSFLVSALFLSTIRSQEPAPATSEGRRNVWREIDEGVRVVFGNPLLRSITGAVATTNLFSSMLEAIWVLYAVRSLGIEPGALGIIFGSGNVGFLAGAFAAGPIARRLGVGGAIAVGVLLVGTGDLLISLAGGPAPVVVLVLLLAQFLFGLGLTIFNINQVSLRQGITPERLQGRMNATISFLGWGIAPLGALAGGLLSELIGLRWTLVLAATGELLAVLWVLLSPLRGVREQPAPLPETANHH